METRIIEALRAYIPMDRLQALAQDRALPDRALGAGLFADLSGFTPLTETLVRELGAPRGAEELARHLDAVYTALIAELNEYGGSVIGFSGDAITCWFDAGTGTDPQESHAEKLRTAVRRAVTCALAMQAAIQRFAAITTPSGKVLHLALKAAVASGPVRRFLVGDPSIQLIDVLAGTTVDSLGEAEHLAARGEVLLSPEALALLGERASITEWREHSKTGRQFCVISGLETPAAKFAWPSLPPDRPREEIIRPWLLSSVYERLQRGLGEFLADFRPVVTLFLRFQGIDYDHDEAGHEKLDRYIRWIQGVVNRYEGHLLQVTIGDKGSYICIAFGAPIAHEDDAVRAVSTALELSQPPVELAYIEPAQIGVAQGQMLAGAYGSPSRRTYGAMSDEINLSARLMEAAAPGQVLASQVTSQATAGLYSWESLPALKLKGKSEPVPVYALAGKASQRPGRLQASRYAVPMVGRQAELEQIDQKGRLAVMGQGQVIAITAEAGMGKSRLIAEATARLENAGFDFFIGECQSFGTHTGYLVWQPVWRGLFGLDPAARPEDQIRRLAEELGRLAPGLAPRLPLLGAVLNLPVPDNELTRSFDAKLRKTTTESLLVECLRACARKKPVLLVLEDCHWLDPLSRDLLETIGRSIADQQVLLITASRQVRLPELDSSPLSQLPHYLAIPLRDFTPQEAERLVRLKLEMFFGPQTEVQPWLAERIIRRADGNPFYIEELLNYLISQGLAPEDRQSLEHLDLPTSLHSLILSRIDQLTESQVAALKVASVIGRLFKAAMLWGVYPALGDSRQVVADLESLRKLELMEIESDQPELTYLFKQVITQEVAYESLPYATRAALHEQIGRFIERSFSDRLDQYLDLLAFHYEHSSCDEKKRAYLLRAGEAAQAKYANTAAIEYYRRLIPLLDAKEQVGVRLKLGQVLVLVGEWQAAGEVLLQAMDSAEDLADYPALNWCRVAIADLVGKQGQYAEAGEWLELAQAGFQSLGDMTGVGKVLHSRGTLAAQQGDFKQSQALYKQSLAIRRRLRDQPQVASLLSNLAILARLEGDYTLARALHEEGLNLRRALGDRWAIANSLNNLGNVALDQQDYTEARACLEEAVALLREIGDRWAIANSLNNLGNVARTQDDFHTARDLYLESLQIYREFGDQRALAYLLEDIAGSAAQQGQAEQALMLVGCAAGLRLAIGSPLSQTESAKLDRLLEPAHQKLDELDQAAAWGRGRGLSLAEVIQVALMPTE